jgi:predicted GIY-YIG superfamily endonuclease
MRTTKSDETYYLYWICRECHTDITKEGYIGITKNPDTRFRSHCVAAKKDNRSVIARALNKYKDIEYKILCIGDREYIIDLEYKLRPKESVGWNIAIGGMNCNLGRLYSDEEKYKLAVRTTKLKKKDVIKIIIDFYIKNLTYSEIGRKFGISSCTVSRHIKDKTILYPELDGL